MADPTNPTAPARPEARGFPFVTALGAAAILFLFVGLVVWVYGRPNPLNEPALPGEPKPDPAARLGELRAKNQAVLDANPGTGAKMSVAEATARLLGSLKTEKDTLPFPAPEPAGPPAPEPKPKKP